MTTSFHQQIQDAGGLYALTCRKIAEKRASYSVQHVRWTAPVPKLSKIPAVNHEPITLGKVEKLKPLNVASVDAVDERDEDLETLLHEDMPSELNLSPIEIEAGIDEPEVESEGVCDETL